MEHRTVIVIAHRLSTIRRADKIVVLEQRAHPRNRHARRTGEPGGIYQRLHELQFVECRIGGGLCERAQHDRLRPRAEKPPPKAKSSSASRASTTAASTCISTCRPSSIRWRAPSAASIKDGMARGHVQIQVSFTRSAARQTAGLEPARCSMPTCAPSARRPTHYRLDGKPDLNAALRIPGMFGSRRRRRSSREELSPGRARSRRRSASRHPQPVPRARRRGHRRRDAPALRKSWAPW